MAYRIVNIIGSQNVTKDELFDSITHKIKDEYIDASVTADINVTIVSTDAQHTPMDVAWKKSANETVVGTLTANSLHKTSLYLVKDYDKTCYTAYAVADKNGAFEWTVIGDLGMRVVKP